MKGIIGLAFIVIGFGLLIWGGNEKNDFFHHTRTYTLITKHQSEHSYKGKYHPDYYITVKYDDDNQFNWTKSVGGASYFSMTEGCRYEERADNKSITILFLLVVGFMLVGSIFLSIFMTDSIY